MNAIPLSDLEFARRSPVRVPDWRWRRAFGLVFDDRPAMPDRADEPVRALVRFLRRVRWSDDGTRREPFGIESDVASAVRLGHGTTREGLELRARILARQSPRAISRLTGHPVGVVIRFEQLLFNITDRLRAGDYVEMVVRHGLPGHSPAERLLLRAAHAHGPGIIEPWLDYLAHAGEPHDLATPEGRRREAIGLAVDAESIPVEAFAGERLHRVLPFLQEIEQLRVRPRSIGEVFASAAARALGELPSTSGSWNHQDEVERGPGNVSAGARSPDTTMPRRFAGAA